MTRFDVRRVRTGLLAAALILPVAGCSAIADSIAGVRPVPTESTDGAPLSQVTAEAITARVLAQASAAGTAAGAAPDAARKQVLSGQALTATQAAVAAKVAPPATKPATTRPAPTVLAMSQGRSWPRWILATTLEADTKIQRLHYLTSATPTSPFVLTAQVPMLSGAQVPSLGAVNAGVKAAASNPAPAAVLSAYAAALAYPKPTATQVVTLNDAFAAGLKTAAADQVKALGTLATLTQSHAVPAGAAGAPIVIPLADGGSLVFGQLVRTDTLTLTASGQTLNMTTEIKAITGKATASKSVAQTSVESLAFIVPPSGAATLIGADEQLSGAVVS